MSNDRLRELLGELHGELSRARAVDPEVRRLLAQLLEDIHAVTGEPAAALPEGVTTQLRETALRIEAEHPRLANALGQLSDTLAKLGI